MTHMNADVQPLPIVAQPAASPSPAVPARQPSRALLITAGVLSIIAFFCNSGWNAMFILATMNGKLSTIPVVGYSLLGMASLAGIVFASISFASVSWSARASGVIQALFVLSYLVTIPQIDAAPVPAILTGFALFSALAAGLSFLGARQASRVQAWRGQR